MNNYGKALIALLIVLTINSTRTFAQDEIDQYVTESVGDAEKLIKAYVQPAMNSISQGLNQGWYNTAKPHKVAGFDLTFTINAMMIPDDEQFFDAKKLNLERLEMAPTSPDYTTNQHLTPTLFGPDRAPRFRVKDDPTNATFEGPPGLGLKDEFGINAAPVPMLHLGFGLPKGFDVKVRYLPPVFDFGDSDVKVFGLGVMHDVKQWIPGIKSLPFDLSAFAAFTNLKVESPFEGTNTQDAKGVFSINAYTLQGIISKKISVLTVYGALGFNAAKSSLDLKGKFDINDDNDYNDAREVDPIAMDFSNSGLRMTGGFRLKLAVLTLHADYTVQKYDCLTVGLGIAVR